MLTKAITEGGNTDTTTYTYYDDLRIKTVTLPDSSTVTFTYHADGSRATKTTATEYIEYHYAGGLVKEVHMDASNHSVVLFTVHYEPSRYTVDPSSQGGGDEVYYYPVTDVQGTVYKLLDASGVEVASYTYSPFGERLTNSAPSIYMPLGYGGTYSDPEIGLLYAKSRYYDPVTTRFTTKDSYRGSKSSIISQNRYIYCHQNPVKYADPAGYAPIEGDRAEPCTQTDQDMHHEPSDEELLPPEPNNPNPEPGFAVNPGGGTTGMADTKGEDILDAVMGALGAVNDTSFTLTIGGFEVTITMDSDGGLTCTSVTGGSNKENSEIKSAMNDFFGNEANKDFVNSITGGGDPKTFKQNMKMLQWFINKNFDTFLGISGSRDFSGNVFSFLKNSFKGLALANEAFGHKVLWGKYRHRWLATNRFRLDAMISSGFWVSYNNEQFGWDLPFNAEGNSFDTALSLVGFTKFTYNQFLYESPTKPFGRGWDPKEFGTDEHANNYMGVKLKNVKAMNNELGLNFNTGVRSGVFESIGMGNTWMSMALNTVSQSWVKDSKFQLGDLAIAAQMYNFAQKNIFGQTLNSYAGNLMGRAFGGDHWKDIGHVDNTFASNDFFKEGKYEGVNLNDLIDDGPLHVKPGKHLITEDNP